MSAGLFGKTLPANSAGAIRFEIVACGFGVVLMFGVAWVKNVGGGISLAHVAAEFSVLLAQLLHVSMPCISEQHRQQQLITITGFRSTTVVVALVVISSVSVVASDADSPAVAANDVRTSVSTTVVFMSVAAPSVVRVIASGVVVSSVVS